VLKTKEALKEEKLQRKEEEKRRSSGNNKDFLAAVGIHDPGSILQNSHFGLKTFRINLRPQILDKFPPKNKRYQLI
jgi:hypothetical protein